MKNPVVDILLPTYNGERFVRAQIESILSQTYQNWRLLIRDDGSSDGTMDILRSYLGGYPDRMTLVEDGRDHLGACQSFAALLSHSTSDYVAFCDQDDVWFPEKMELTLNRMIRLEQAYDKPVLVHTDIKVVDKNLCLLSDSFWKYQRVNPGRKNLNHVLIQNNVTGCAMMINRKLKDISLPIPQEAIMYDWWIALAASAFGVFDYIDTPTMLYRQHSRSDTGAKKYTPWYFLSRMNRIEEGRKSIGRTLRQGRTFLERFQDRLNNSQLEIVRNFSQLFQVNRLSRLRLLFKHDLGKYGTLRNMGFVMVVWLHRGEDG